ncbi:MRM1 methyltransferase, partial [Polyodon spathula]|nr:MRM1 methyltransferase [Polyodon spathula]
MPGPVQTDSPSGIAYRNMKNKDSEIVFGVSPCYLALTHGRRSFHGLYVKESRIQQRPEVREIYRLAEILGVTVHQASRRALDGLCGGRVHQGMCLEASPLGYMAVDERIAPCTPGQSLWLVLEGIQDPMNMGALLRTAYFLGVDRVVASLHNRVSEDEMMLVILSSSRLSSPLAFAGGVTRSEQVGSVTKRWLVKAAQLERAVQGYAWFLFPSVMPRSGTRLEIWTGNQFRDSVFTELRFTIDHKKLNRPRRRAGVSKERGLSLEVLAMVCEELLTEITLFIQGVLTERVQMCFLLLQIMEQLSGKTILGCAVLSAKQQTRLEVPWQGPEDLGSSLAEITGIHDSVTNAKLVLPEACGLGSYSRTFFVVLGEILKLDDMAWLQLASVHVVGDQGVALCFLAMLSVPFSLPSVRRVSVLPSQIATFSVQLGGVKLREKRSEATSPPLSLLQNYSSPPSWRERRLHQSLGFEKGQSVPVSTCAPSELLNCDFRGEPAGNCPRRSPKRPAPGR